MQIDKDMILKLLRSRGDHEKASQAEQELPDKVDDEQHRGLLEKFGVDPKEVLGKLGGLGGMFGKGRDSAGQALAAVLTVVAVIGLIVFVAIAIESYDTEEDVEAARRQVSPSGQSSSGSTSQETPAGAADTGAGSVLTAGTRSLLPVPPKEELASLAGREVLGRAAPVESVVANEGFWVGTSATDRIFVFLTPAARGTSGESPFTVQAGQKVELTGTLKALSGEPSSLGVDESEGASTLRSQGHYVEATSARVS